MTQITLPITPTPEMIEAMARALCYEDGHDPDGPASWDGGAKLWFDYYGPAIAAYRALVDHLRGQT